MEVKVSIPKRRKLFDTFITIGICPDYLESIDLNTLLLTPKLTYSYPDNQTSNYEYYKNFCYKDGVNVTRMELSSENEYSVNVLENNFFSKPISTFAFMKPSLDKAPDKYIYGIKFNDIFIFKPKKNVKENTINVFKYEKCYLFISNEPYFQTLEVMCNAFLNAKKLNYLNNLTSFICFFEQGKLDNFHQFNNENNNETIKSIIQKVYKSTYQTSIKYLNETYPNTIDNNESYLCWLLRKVISHYDSSTFFRIMVMVLLEQQVLFYGNNLELITFSSLLFSSIIYPFKWKFPLIPNLPIDQIQMLSSPVPYIAGIQAEEKDLIEIKENSTTNLIKVEDDHVEIIQSLNNDYNYKDCLYYLNGLIDRSFWKVESEHFKRNEKITKKYCEEIREDILKGINTSIIDKMKTHILSKNGKEFDIENIKNVIRKEIIAQWDSKFFIDFCETEMFICLYETLLNN